ncbi:MAG: YdcF family protein [Deltaproteobacteria bacterium]
MGKKVIATPIQEILIFNQTHNNPIAIAATAEKFAATIQNELGKKTIFYPESVEIAKTNAWEQRIGSMLSLIDQKVLKKEEAVEKNWSRRIKIIHRAMTRKIAIASACLILGYAIFFHSKVPYYIAQPLKIEDPLIPADAVLALGGGVGESGLAGQGYQERVKTAVTLYQKGWVKKIIFSSGYVYLMKEAQVMKNLAVAMGVPETDIFIEDSGGNTYENITYFSKFIQREELKKVIIVSSPYHMKRTQLVAEKHLPAGTSFLLKPVENSLFFNSLSSDPTLEQLKAILHEYAAIAYYKFKGRI